MKICKFTSSNGGILADEVYLGIKRGLTMCIMYDTILI